MNKQLSTMIFTTLLLLVCTAAGQAQQTTNFDLELLFTKKLALYYRNIHPIGDQNGDGYGDFVLINADEGQNLIGHVEIYYGGEEIDTTARIIFKERFWGVAVMDCNHDGYVDILAQNYDNYIHVFFGGPQLTGETPDQVIENPNGIDSSRSKPGQLWATNDLIGDFNGDGILDLCIMDLDYPYYYPQLGILHFYSTSHSGIDSEPFESITYADEHWQIFPSLFSSGDINGDGCDDLSIFLMKRTEEEDGYSNPLYKNRKILYGHPELDFHKPDKQSPKFIDFPLMDTGFGVTDFWIIPDIDNDGYDDILCSDQNNRYYEWYFNFMIMKGGTHLDTIPDYGFNSANDWMTHPIPVGDFNGDGYNDLMADFHSTGRARLWLGGNPFYPTASVFFYDYHYNDYFGNTMGTVGDVNGDGLNDIIVGSATTFSAPRYSDFYIYAGNSEITGVADEEAVATLPESFSVEPPYPNPFNSTTNFKLSLPEAGMLKYTIYDSSGSEITSIESSAAAGEHTVEFNAGRYKLASGIYFAQFHFATSTKEYTQTVKMQYLK